MSCECWDRGISNPPSTVDRAAERGRRDEWVSGGKARTGYRRAIFLQILKKRPRLGTALDKVYGYHVGRGSLDRFCESLEAEATETDSGNLWLVLGMVQMHRGHDAQAVISLQQAEQKLPNEPLASYYLGKTLILLGEVDEAVAAMRRAIDRRPARADMMAVFQDLGRLYQRTGRGEEALAVWKQLESLFPGDTRVREEVANILAEEGALAAALDRYTALATMVDDRYRQIELAIRAAQLKAQLGQTDAALEDFETVLADVRPESWLHQDIRRRIEEVFWSSGNVDGLVAYYMKWVEKNPEDVDAMMRTGRVLSIQRRTPEAVEWFRKAIERAPSKAEPRLALVEALVTDERLGEATQEMKELVKHHPDDPDYVVRYGELVWNDLERDEKQRRVEAGKIWRTLLRNRGQDPVTMARVADLLRGTSDTEGAIEYFRKAIQLAPNEPQYREYLGEYFHQLDRKEEALATWSELATGDRETPENLFRLSEVFSTFGYPEKALATLEIVCARDPTFNHRARYAQVLREASRFDDALAQLELAEPLADSPEYREMVIEERIRNYQESDTLEQRIAQAEAAVAGTGSQDAQAWRLLAMLRDADGKYELACDAIDRATELAPDSAIVWETAAPLQERSGRFGDAVKTYRRLAAVDRRFLSNYLTQIASLQMRLGNIEEALQTGQELIASAPGNTDHYRTFAEMCFRVGQTQRGLDVLRRSVRNNPHDADMLLYLARVLADEFQTDEAIELYWKGFDLATDLEGKSLVIKPLAELYLRTNRFESLVDRLEMTAREQNKPRDRTLWVAAAHQAAGDLGMAKQLLETLVRQDSRDTQLLEELVGLARAEVDFETAAEYQRRLASIAPSPRNQYMLANILLEVGEINQAEALWVKLAQRKSDPAALSKAIAALIQKEQLTTAGALIERTLAQQPNNWEVLSQAMIVFAKLGRGEDARNAAERILAMNVDPAEPTAKVKEDIKQRASRQDQSAYSYDPYQNLGEPSRFMQLARSIKRTLSNESFEQIFGGRQQLFTPSCFQDAQALAYCIPLVVPENGKGFDEADFVNNFVEEAVRAGKRELLWQAVFYVLWTDPNGIYGQEPNQLIEKCLNALVEKNDPDAANSLVSQFSNRRQRQSGGKQDALPPLTDDEINYVTKLVSIAGTKRNTSYQKLWLAGELARVDRHAAAEALLDEYVEATKTQRYAEAAMLQAANALVHARTQAGIPEVSLAKAQKLLRTALAGIKLRTGSLNSSRPQYNQNGIQLAGIVQQLAEQDHLDMALQTIDDVLGWQAGQTAALPPSRRDRLHTRGAPLNYNRYVNNQYVRNVVTFPPPSSYFGAESILPLYSLYLTCKDDGQKLAQVTAHIDAWSDKPSEDVYLRLARSIAAAAFSYWTGDNAAAKAALMRASEQQIGSQFIALAQTRLLYDAGDIREALAVVEQLTPTNQRMLVDRELTILQLVLQLGDLERAKQSAQRLFALRHNSETSFKLADLMYQLGMRDLADRMMQRIRRRAGGKQDTLVQLMTRYAEANENEAAAEIARQVIRRTEPRGTRRYYNSSHVQHDQAVRVLAQTKQLDPLIARYEELVERSPKVTKLVDKLASFYEAAGRRDDARQLRVKAASEDGAQDPQSLLAAGHELARLRKHNEAIEKYIAAIVKAPDMFDNQFYEMEKSFKETKTWHRLSDAIIDEGLEKFTSSYFRFGSLCRRLMQQQDVAAANRLMVAGLKKWDLRHASRIVDALSAQKEYKPSQEVIDLVGQKLTAANSTFLVSQPNFVNSRSSNGHTTGTADGFAKLVAMNTTLRQQVADSMKQQLEKNESRLFPRVLLALILIDQRDFDGLREVVQPLMDEKKKTPQHAEALWCLASSLTFDAKQPAIACDLIESVEDQSLFGSGNSDFTFTVHALLAYAYEQAERHADARRILIGRLRDLRVDAEQSRHNPGYGEYQYIRTMSSLSERFLKMGYRAEAFIAYRRAYGNESMVEKASRWSSSSTRNQESLAKKIAAKIGPQTIIDVVQSALAPPEASDSDGISDFLTVPMVRRNSLIDTAVTMPLEEFTQNIAEQPTTKKAVAEWLRDNPLPAETDARTKTLKPLVTRLLVGNAVGLDDDVATTAGAILEWVQSNAPTARPDPQPTSSTAVESTAATTPGQSETASKNTAAALPDEMLLGMVTARLPASVDNESAIAILQRAIDIAVAHGESALATSLECQVAARLATSQPEEARAIFQQTLDELLPSEAENEAHAAEKKS